jgi:hypothetical protein
MSRWSVVTTAWIILAAVAPAAGAHLVESRGAASCETWLKQRPNNAKLHESWLLGFLSGVSQEADIHFPKVMDNAALFKWMDDYCRQNPRQTIQMGGYMLMGKLRSTLPPDPKAK